MRRKELVPVALEGAGKVRALGAARDARSDPATGRTELVHILSPFDPLIIQRKRLQLFFGYEHRFEAYVPKEKRVFGYFALPVLVGDEIVAAIDLKTDRQQQKLLVQKWTWVGKARPGRTSGGSRRSCTASSASNWQRKPKATALSSADRPGSSVDLNRGAVGDQRPDFADLLIGDSDAAIGPVPEQVQVSDKAPSVRQAVNYDVAPRRVAGGRRTRRIGRSRIGNMEAEIGGGLRVAPVNEVTPLRGSLIPFALFVTDWMASERNPVLP